MRTDIGEQKIDIFARAKRNGQPIYTCPEKFRTTSQGAEMGQNFSGGLYLVGESKNQLDNLDTISRAQALCQPLGFGRWCQV